MNDYILITGDAIQLGDLMPVEGNRWGIVTEVSPLMVFGRHARKVTIQVGTDEGTETAQVGDAEQIRVRRGPEPSTTTGLDDDGGCGAWNYSHICRLPVDEDGRHEGDHRCGGCGDVWNQGPDDYDENFENDYDGPTCEDEHGITYRTPEPPEVRAAWARTIARAARQTIEVIQEHKPGGQKPFKVGDRVRDITGAQEGKPLGPGTVSRVDVIDGRQWVAVRHDNGSGTSWDDYHLIHLDENDQDETGGADQPEWSRALVNDDWMYDDDPAIPMPRNLRNRDDQGETR